MHVTGLNRREDPLRLAGGDVPLRLPWNEFGQWPVQPVGSCTRGLAQLIAAVGQPPQRLELRVAGQHPKASGAEATTATACASCASVLRSCPVSSCRARGRELRRHVHHVLTIGQQPLRQGTARAVAALHRPHPLGVGGDVISHRRVPDLARGEPAPGQDLLLLVDDFDGL